MFFEYGKVLLLNFSEIGNTVFFYLKSWWKVDIFLFFFNFSWYSRTSEIWFFVQCEVFTVKNEFVVTPNWEHKYTNYRKRRERWSMGWEEKSFLFFYAKKKISVCEKTTKEVRKEKPGLKKYSRKDKQKAQSIWWCYVSLCNNSLSHFVIPDALCNNSLSQFEIPNALCNKFLSHFVITVFYLIF